VEKSNPDFSTVPTALGNPATDAGFPHFPSHDGGVYRLPLKTKPAKIAGPVRFLRRALFLPVVRELGAIAITSCKPIFSLLIWLGRKLQYSTAPNAEGLREELWPSR